MADDLERALIVAEIAELQKCDSEAHIKAIYVELTPDDRAAGQNRERRLAALRLQLAEIDASPGGAPHGRGAS
jgi:hypothetical protein